jgi:hypothetical protein
MRDERKTVWLGIRQYHVGDTIKLYRGPRRLRGHAATIVEIDRKGLRVRWSTQGGFSLSEQTLELARFLQLGEAAAFGDHPASCRKCGEACGRVWCVQCWPTAPEPGVAEMDRRLKMIEDTLDSLHCQD